MSVSSYLQRERWSSFKRGGAPADRVSSPLVVCQSLVCGSSYEDLVLTSRFFQWQEKQPGAGSRGWESWDQKGKDCLSSLRVKKTPGKKLWLAELKSCDALLGSDLRGLCLNPGLWSWATCLVPLRSGECNLTTPGPSFLACEMRITINL